MEVLNSLGVLLGSSWASGVNLYLTIAGLGIADRLGWIALPGNLDTLSHPLIILIAVLLYVVEFVADKIPYVDSAWDSVHTFIRPLGGAALGYMAMAGTGPVLQIPVALLTGAVSADSHLTKATTRVAINTSPEPVTNSIASVTEDSLVAVILFLIIQHPIIAAILVILFVLFSIWFLKKMFRFLKKVFRFLGGKKPESAPAQ
ncbi:MAG: DUF4126 domain-containing protein [Candidatus Omnitrophota bacterium]|nr:MAG: DUF4126 domain-containing protein [Candidatus Omnitrophota bacterium]